MRASRLNLLIAAMVLGGAAPAHAGESGECAAVRRAMSADDVTRASILLGACAGAAPDDAASLEGAIRQRATALGYSPIEVVTTPAGEPVVASVAPELTFTAPLKIWLPPGTHELFLVDADGTRLASSQVVAEGGSRAVVLLRRIADAPPPGSAAVDFSDEAAGEVQTGGPEDVEFASLLPERYRKGLQDRPAGWTDDATGGPRTGYRVALGYAFARAGGRNATGAMLLARAAYHVARPGPRLRVAPELAVTLARVDDDGLVQLHGAVLLEAAWLYGGRGGAFALGPGATWVNGLTARDGSGVTGVATGEIILGRASVLARAELPLWSSADVRTATFTFGVGLRW